MIINKNEMVGTMIEKVRSACAEQGIRHGAIGVGTSVIGRNRTLYEWRNSPESSVAELSIAPIGAGEDTLCYDEDEQVVGDGAGMVAERIFGLRRWLIGCMEEERALYDIKQYTSAALPDRMVIPGLSNRPGAIAIVICMLAGGGCTYRDMRAIVVYAAVVGGTDEQNENAARSALDYIRNEVIDQAKGFRLAEAFEIAR